LEPAQLATTKGGFPYFITQEIVVAMLRQDIYKEAYKEALKDPALSKAREEFTPKTFRASWKWALLVGIVFQIIFQIVSGATAFTFIAWIPFFFTGYWSPGVIVGFWFLPLLEWGKHKDWSLFWREWWLFERGTNWPALFIGLGLLVISLTASLLGTPILVEHITPAPKLVDIEGMKEEAKLEKDSILNFWESRSDTMKAQASIIAASNSWRGTVTRTARPVVLAHNSRALAFVDSSTLKIAIIQSNLLLAIQEAKLENNGREKEHKEKSQWVGNWAMLGTFLLELFTIFILMGRKYYWFRSIVEVYFPDLQSDKERRIALSKIPVENKSLSQDPVEKKLSNFQSFKSGAKEGELKKINGVWHIAFLKDNGESKFYQNNILSTRISQTRGTNKETFNRLVDLKEKLSKHIKTQNNGTN